MKKLVLVLLVFLGSLTTHAQKNGFGLKGGLSSTQVNFEADQLVPSDAQLGYHLGGVCKIRRNRIFCTARGIVYAD